MTIDAGIDDLIEAAGVFLTQSLIRSRFFAGGEAPSIV